MKIELACDSTDAAEFCAQAMTEPRASREQAAQTKPAAAALVGVALRTWEDWESPRVATCIPTPMLRLYRHLAGLERLPFARR